MSGEEIKSAYELAMERLGGASSELSEEHKERLAEVERRLKADMAQVDIMMERDMMLAKASGDAEALAAVREKKAHELATLQADAEDAKNRIRKG